jgi:hypothetical protein
MAAAVPDFSGVWERDPPLKTPGTSTDVLFAFDSVMDGEQPQFREPYASQYKAYQEKAHAALVAGKPLSDRSIQCLPNGMPTMMLGILPIQIVQNRREMVVIAEELSEVRQIYFNEKLPSLDDIVTGYRGYSVGRFEGSTLVVETLGIREDVQYFDMPHSENMKLVERYKLTAPNMLEIRFEIQDPERLLRPYRFTFTYKKNTNYHLAEYVCDNNQYRVNDDGTVHFGTQLDSGAAKK